MTGRPVNHSYRHQASVWIGCVDDTLRPADVALLSDDERARFERLVFPRDQARFAGAHAAIRRTLARYLGVAPEAVRLDRHPCPGCGSGTHGPPRVIAPISLSISISRSVRHWLLGITRNGPVGVDLEHGRELDVASLARVTLSAGEQKYVNARHGQARIDAFYRCWTRKEAVVKAMGLGLAANVREVDVHPADSHPVVIHHSAGDGLDAWCVLDLPIGTGFFAALAVPHRTMPAR